MKSNRVIAWSCCKIQVMKPKATTPKRAPYGSKQICLPFDSEAHYENCVNDLAQYRAHLTNWMQRHPALFPKAMQAGYRFHAQYRSRKQNLTLRRVKVVENGAVFTLRPSFVTPWLTARTADVEKALYLRHWGVPFEALAYCCGRDPMFWYRAELQFGRPNLVGTTVKDAAALPRDLVADEKITWLNKAELCLPTIAAAGCLLGISVATETTGAAFQAAYGEFAQETAAVFSDYQPQSVCTDGFRATRWAWLQLYPRICLVLCFLHGVLKLRERCKNALRKQVLDRVWHIYEGTDRRQFRQRLRRFHEWSQQHLEGALLTMAQKLWERGADYARAYDCPTAARTSNGVDRLLNHLDRVLYAMRYGHGTKESLRWMVRAAALHWNFHPYGTRLRRDQPERQSPFADLNGFQYHENWLHNFYIASSMGGLRP